MSALEYESLHAETEFWFSVFWRGGRENINIESVYSAFSSDILKSRKFPGTVRNRTVVDANGMFL